MEAVTNKPRNPRQGFAAVDGVSFAARAGEITGYLGVLPFNLEAIRKAARHQRRMRAKNTLP